MPCLPPALEVASVRTRLALLACGGEDDGNPFEGEPKQINTEGYMRGGM